MVPVGEIFWANGKEYIEKVLKKGTALELYDAACAMWPSFLLRIIKVKCKMTLN